MAEKKGVGHAYNIDFLNVVFAASSLFLFLSVVWMVWDDYEYTYPSFNLARHGEFGSPDARETSHDPGDRSEQSEKRGEGDDGVHCGEEPSCAFDFHACGGLECALEAGMAMGDAGTDHAENGIFCRQYWHTPLQML